MIAHVDHDGRGLGVVQREFSFVECEMFGFGLPEAVILGIIVLVLFGRRLPSLFRSLGESLPAFKQGLAQDHLETPVEGRKNLEARRASESV